MENIQKDLEAKMEAVDLEERGNETQKMKLNLDQISKNNDDEKMSEEMGASEVICFCTLIFCGDNYDCFNTCGCNVQGDPSGEEYGTLGCRCPAMEGPPCECNCTLEDATDEAKSREAFFGKCDWYNEEEDKEEEEESEPLNVNCFCTEIACGDDYDCFNSCPCNIEGDPDGEKYGNLACECPASEQPPCQCNCTLNTPMEAEIPLEEMYAAFFG